LNIFRRDRLYRRNSKNNGLPRSYDRKKMQNANDFLQLIEPKNASIIIDESLTSKTEDSRNTLKLLIDNVKAVPDKQ
jgi:hypothetical protein